MTEKIIYSPDRASPDKAAPTTAPAAKPSGGAPQGRATDPRLFADLLAEAEAVQDHVELHGPYRAGHAPASPEAPAPVALRDTMRNALQGGLQGVAGLLNRAPHRSQNPRAIKPREKTG